jgi:hypothetical protein
MLVAFVFTVSALAQITVTPPNVPGVTAHFPYLYLNSPADWGQLAPQNIHSTESGFLPNVPVTRVVGGQGVHWGSIMTGPPASSTDTSVYSAGLAGLGMNYDSAVGTNGANCLTVTNGYWWPQATCFASGGRYNANPNNILYTFYTVPQWASVINGTHGSPIDGWTVASTDCTAGICTLTLNTTGNPNINPGGQLFYWINGTPHQVNVNSVSNSNSTAPVIAFGYSGTAGNSSNSYVTFTNTEPPSDANNATETCKLPDGNPATGHCYFKEYVTWMMMHTCRDSNGTFNGVTVKYAVGDTNALNTCVIHYWEGWNEFNSNNFWSGSYTQLAHMMDDAAYIIHQYCKDCFLAAGSVTAGGDAGRPPYIPASDGSVVYLEALGQLLHDWNGFHSSTKPDMLSIHPYPGTDNIYMPAMPESSIPARWDPSVAPYSTQLASNACSTSNVVACINICNSSGYNPSGGSCTAVVANPLPAGTAGDPWAGAPAPGCGTQQTRFTKYVPASTYTNPSPEIHCRDSFLNEVRATRQLLTDIVTVGDLPSGWVSTTLPLWNTESGWGGGDETNFLGATPVSLHDPHDSTLETFFQQSYMARYGILASESELDLNLLYQWDINHTITCSHGTGDCDAYPLDLQSPWQDQHQNWGQLGSKFTRDPVSPTSTNGTFKPTRPAYTFNRVLHWLTGATFNGTAPAMVARNTFYNYGAVVYDGLNVHTVMVAGTSGATAPTWNNAVYGTTADGSTLVWENMGDKNCRDTSTFSSANNINQNVWACYITKSGGYTGTVVWYTPFDSVILFNTPSGQTCLKDIDGGLATVTVASAHHIYNRPALFDSTSSCSGTDGLPEADFTP